MHKCWENLFFFTIQSCWLQCIMSKMTRLWSDTCKIQLKEFWQKTSCFVFVAWTVGVLLAECLFNTYDKKLCSDSSEISYLVYVRLRLYHFTFFVFSNSCYYLKGHYCCGPQLFVLYTSWRQLSKCQPTLPVFHQTFDAPGMSRLLLEYQSPFPS